MPEIPRGRFVWYELLTTDPEGAEAFYGSLMGWGTDEWQAPVEDMPPYRMWTVDGTSIGGIMELPEEARQGGAPPHWLGHIATPDADATAARAEELGATVLMGPHSIPEVGRFAVIRDPWGATFSAYTPAGEAPGHEGEPKVGEVVWHELLTEDYAGAADFYGDLFGWTRGEPMDMGEMGIYQIVERNGVQLGGIMNRPPEWPSSWLYYVRVDDLDGKIEAVRSTGGKILNGPMEVPGGGRIAQGLDPQGGAFAIFEAGEMG
ncbi:MAG TPA: VOC family protein [Longimicrobiales bacterium]|nr:VOC family protein [Longimicrobiales bacterium]